VDSTEVKKFGPENFVTTTWMKSSHDGSTILKA